MLEEQTEFSNSGNYPATFQWLSLSLSKQLEVPTVAYKVQHDLISCSPLDAGSSLAPAHNSTVVTLRLFTLLELADPSPHLAPRGSQPPG